MIELTVLCEGPTEVGFVATVLKPHLERLGTFTKAIPLSQGNFGVVSWRTLYAAQRASVGRARRHQFTTSLIDLFRLPADYTRDVPRTSTKRQWALDVEARMWAEMPSPQWIPHVQLHEFESMIFVDLGVLPGQFPDEDLDRGLAALRREVERMEPEDINDGPETAPSKRIRRHLDIYGKAAAGPAIVREIGIEKIKAACPHFHGWVEVLEGLSARESTWFADEFA